MKSKKLNQKGFSHFEAILLIVVLVVIGSVGTFVYSRMHKSQAGSNLGINYPYDVATDNLGHIWVANSNNSVTELNAKDGSLVRVVK